MCGAIPNCFCFTLLVALSNVRPRKHSLVHLHLCLQMNGLTELHPMPVRFQHAIFDPSKVIFLLFWSYFMEQGKSWQLFGLFLHKHQYFLYSFFFIVSLPIVVSCFYIKRKCLNFFDKIVAVEQSSEPCSIPVKLSSISTYNSCHQLLWIDVDDPMHLLQRGIKNFPLSSFLMTYSEDVPFLPRFDILLFF